MTSITPFSFPETGQPVRTITLGGEPWFVTTDVCTVLAHTNASQAVATLDEDEKGVSIAETPGGPQQVGIVSESGLYSLILRSRKPQARAFKRWITREVIPSIRRTGSYTVAPAAPALPDITTAAGVLAMAEQFARTARQLVEADAKLRELEPKAIAHDTYLSAQSGERLIREVAKLLAWRQQDLRRFLVEEKFIFAREALCGATTWDFYAAHASHFRSIEHPVEHHWGRCSHYTLYVRPAGVDLIQRRIAKRKASMDAAITDTP
ncbi:phage antirepressor [Embleya sp. NPDC056575]|uniref:phage antirepressor n=1 Tax=unclassified Embleya TaxID=2699296 RepID=UPI0036865935